MSYSCHHRLPMGRQRQIFRRNYHSRALTFKTHTSEYTRLSDKNQYVKVDYNKKYYSNIYFLQLAQVSKPNPTPQPNPPPNQQAASTNSLAPISEHTPYPSRHAAPKGKASIASSIIEHKRHVSEAVDHIHSDQKRKLKKKRAQKGGEEDSTRSNESSDLSQYSMSLLRHADHTPFTAEPHPLITSEELSSRHSFSSSKAADVSSRNLYGWTKISSPIVTGGRSSKREVVPPLEDDPEYFSEITDVSKKYRPSTAVSC